MHGGDVHDAPVVVGYHGEPGHLSAEAEEAREVRVHDVVPLLVSHEGRVAGAADAAGVHEDVDLAEVGDDVLDAGRDGFGVAQVYPVRVDFDAELGGDGLRVLLQQVHPAGDEGDVRARVGHGPGELQSEAGRAAGHQGYLAGKVEYVVFHSELTHSSSSRCTWSRPRGFPHYTTNYKRV